MGLPKVPNVPSRTPEMSNKEYARELARYRYVLMDYRLRLQKWKEEDTNASIPVWFKTSMLVLSIVFLCVASYLASI